MSNDNQLEIVLARSMPSWVAWALYGTVTGLALCMGIYISQSWLVWAMASVSLSTTYLFVQFYNKWSLLFNRMAMDGLRATGIFNVLNELEKDGTFTDESCLIKGEKKDEEQESDDGKPTT